MKLLLIAAVAITPLLAKDNEPTKRLNDATVVFTEIMAAPDKGIPQDLIEHAYCIVIVPDLKTAGFIVGAKYGKGYLSCRSKVGPGWSAPATVRIEGGSVMKRDILPEYKDPVALELMRALKRTLDPNGILNPGKVL